MDEVTPYNSTRLVDATAIAFDPKDENHVFISSCGSGLFEMKDGQFVKNYTDGNSPLKSAIDENYNYVRTDGLVFDNNGCLWMSCSAVSTKRDILLRLNPGNRRMENVQL